MSSSASSRASSDTSLGESGSSAIRHRPSVNILPREKSARLKNKEYNLRATSIEKREETQKRIRSPRKPKPKSKPPPLSKYRRRTANARERDRMREMNEAFETLRDAVPQYPTEEDGKEATKIVTLQLAVNYIKALRAMLGYPDIDSDGNVTSESSSAPVSGSDGEACLSPPESSYNYSEACFSPPESYRTFSVSTDSAEDDLNDDIQNIGALRIPPWPSEQHIVAVPLEDIVNNDVFLETLDIDDMSLS